MQDEHQYSRDEERRIPATLAEQGGLGIRCGLHQFPRELLIHTHRFIAVNLYAAHIFQHHAVATQVHRFHVQER